MTQREFDGRFTAFPDTGIIELNCYKCDGPGGPGTRGTDTWPVGYHPSLDLLIEQARSHNTERHQNDGSQSSSADFNAPSWTASDEGRENSSPAFTHLEREIEKLLCNGAAGMVMSHTWVKNTARLILAQLAHVHNVGPLPPKQSGKTIHPQESEDQQPWVRHARGFNLGDKVWPKDGSSMVLQHAPQVVVAVVSHPVFGEWLWLADNVSGVGSYAASSWTTEEPSEGEKARRDVAKAQREDENRAAAIRQLDPYWGTKKFTVTQHEKMG
jgi:hypothetical protein